MADLDLDATRNCAEMTGGLPMHSIRELLDEVTQLRDKLAATEKELDTFRKAYSHVDPVLNEVKQERDKLREALAANNKF